MIRVLFLTFVVIAEASNHLRPVHHRIHPQGQQFHSRQGRSHALPARKSSPLENLIPTPSSASSSTAGTAPLDLKVFDTIREHFQRIREAMNKLEPLTSLPDNSSKNSTKSDSKGTNNTSALLAWMNEITVLATQLPIIHEAVHVIALQFKLLRDRLNGAPITVSVRDADGNLTFTMDQWIRELDKIESEFKDIRESWDKTISAGVPLLGLYTSLDHDLKYQSSDISKQEDIYIPNQRLQSLLRSIEQTRERLRQSIRTSLNRTLPGVEVNHRLILPGQNDTERMSLEEQRARTRDQIRAHTVDTVRALTTSVKLVRTNLSILSELYTKLLASYVLNLTQLRISNGTTSEIRSVPSGIPGNETAIPSSSISTSSRTQVKTSGPQDQAPVKVTAAADPFHDTQDNPYGSLNVIGVVTREVDQIVDLVSGIARLG